MSQKDTLLLSAAAVQVSGLVPGLVDNPHGIVRRARIGIRVVRHSYCGGRRRSMWNVDEGGRILAVGGRVGEQR
jgi:hypothetical protein